MTMKQNNVVERVMEIIKRDRTYNTYISNRASRGESSQEKSLNARPHTAPVYGIGRRKRALHCIASHRAPRHATGLAPTVPVPMPMLMLMLTIMPYTFDIVPSAL